MTKKARCTLGVLGAAVALGLGYYATRKTGPVPMTAFTEEREGPVQAHLLTAGQLGTAPAYVPHRYPPLVAPNLYMVVSQGFAPLYGLPDPQMAALPAEMA